LLPQDATRGRREAGDNGFWKRSPGADSLNDSPASFWKRRSSHEHAPNSNAEFWKRSMHSPEFGSSFAWKSDDGMSSSPKSAAEFWKRFNGIDDNNVIEESLDKRFDETVGDFLSKQRRGDKSSQRRPEFNPTGW
jgi:hypothetical protein